jgi:RNA recognition motif-containing protein
MFITNVFLFYHMNIFVSGLNYSLTSEELSELFAQYGSVSSAKVIMDKMTGRSRGFGFVEMSNDEEGRNAVSALDQSDIKGRKINVKEAEDRPQRSGGDRPQRSFGGDRGGSRDGGFKPRFNRDNNRDFNRDSRY